jgi:hypothetical protein
MSDSSPTGSRVEGLVIFSRLDTPTFVSLHRRDLTAEIPTTHRGVQIEESDLQPEDVCQAGDGTIR